MTADHYGAPPRSGWAKLVCELLVEDLAVSRAFWEQVLGFEVAYQRPEQSFVYLERPTARRSCFANDRGTGRRRPSNLHTAGA